MTFYNDDNTAININNYYGFDDLSNCSNKYITKKEEDFDKLLREYINGIRIYITNSEE